MSLTSSVVRELRLILDAEEYEYLLPNEAIIGFYLSVDSDRDQSISSRMGLKQYERSIDILQPTPESDELFVGSQFHTFIQVGFSDTPIPIQTLKKPKVNPFRSVIRSVVQVAKPIFSSSLLQLKEPVTFSATSRVAKARLVQKWAYLRLENTSAAVVIESLALRLGNLKKDFDEMLQRLVELRAGQHIAPSDEVSLNNMKVY
ncbi:unnamed protein product [Hymenolepis diminuta]|uniref:Rap-GAP domain-containing protein n=1 Tax=Hymenolepis diminuta TaxID=6216 RepID=A0A0R3SY65_HYMDI|nr:unnamed protein product [Hymenolepis diminuta]